MADKLVVLTILLLFVSFRPIFCDGETSLEVSGDVKEGENLSPAFEPGTYLPNVVENSVPTKEKSVHSEGTQSSQHVDEEHTADSESEENLVDTAAPVDTAERKGSPGFFSQVLSELAAPLYEDDEQDFLSEDSDSEPTSTEDATASEEVEDALHETNKDNKNSIEDSDETAETSKEHEQTEFDKKDLTPTEDRTTMLSDEDLEHLRVKSKSAKEEDMADKPEEEELSLNKKEEEELSLNKKEEEKQQDNKEKTDNEAKDLKIGEEAKEPMFEEENKVESQKELAADEGLGEEEGKDREKDEVGDEEMGDGETGEEGERAGDENQSADEEIEKTEERTKQEKKDVGGETERVEKEEDKDREEEEEESDGENNEEEEVDETRKELLEEEEKAAEEKKRAMEEQASKLALEKERRAAEEKERDKEEEARLLALEKERRAEEEREKEREEQEQYLAWQKERKVEEERREREKQEPDLALEKERKVEEEKREREKQEQDLAWEKERKEREKQEQELAWEKERKEREKQEQYLALQKEKRAAEERKRAIEEQASKIKSEKEKRAAEVEKQRKEEEAKRLRLESLQKQLKDVEESERREKERLYKERIQMERSNVNGNKKVVKNPTEVPLHNDKSAGGEQLAKKKDKIIQKQEKASEDSDEEEHMKLKGAFDRKMAAEEAALKRKLEKLNEERQNFEKMAAEYRLSKQARQQKEQKGKEATKQRTGGETRNLGASTVSRSSVQKETLQHQAKATTRTTANAKGSLSASKAGNTGGSTTRIVLGKQNTAANEKLAAKESTADEKPRPDESSQTTPTSVKEPVGGHTKEMAQATVTVTASTTTKVEGEGVSSVDVKSNHLRNGGKKTDPLSEKKETHTDNAQCAEGFCSVKPDVISLASRFQKVESSLSSKVVLGETQFANQENDSSQVNDTLSGYAAFMRAFRNFHDKTVQFVFSYWPAAKNTTRDVLAYVGLDGVFIQLCNDLAEVHPAILFITLVFGSLGFLYFFWSITFGRLRHGAQGPSPRDVLRSYEARARILEEEVKSLEEEKLKSEMDRNNYFKEKKISEEQLQDTNEKLEKLMKSLEKHKKDKHDVEALLKGMKDKYQKLINESKEKSQGIAECENTIADLKLTIETKEREIEKLNDNYEKQQMEKEKSEKHIEGLDEIIEQSGQEKEELEQQLTESKEKIQSLQADFDDQLLRLTELQEQYQFRCNEVEVLKDCLKQIKQTDGEEEPDEDEMAGRLKNLLDVAKFKSVSKTLEEKNAALESETEELRKIKKMLENDNLEKTERMEQAESKASQALLTQREKEIELEALQKYFKSTEVELHRKINAEESSRISIENQLQSEQAKASTAVVDADKYRQLYLDIKKQIEEIDESKKEQLSNMEKKAHQNWLDYRAAARENDGLKDENEILRRKLYDLEVRGSRPSSSASSQLNHVDGRDSPSRRSPMTGLPGHGSPVPFGAPPMMGPPPPPPPSSMFPGQRRPHPAEMMGMTPPRPPFPPPGPASRGHATPPPITNAVTPQSSKLDDRADSFAQDNKDGASQAPAPPMPGYGPPPPPPHPAMMRMPMFPPNRPPMMPPPPPPSGQLPPMFMPRPGGQMPPFPPQGPRPQASSTPNRS